MNCAEWLRLRASSSNEFMVSAALTMTPRPVVLSYWPAAKS